MALALLAIFGIFFYVWRQTNSPASKSVIIAGILYGLIVVSVIAYMASPNKNPIKLESSVTQPAQSGPSTTPFNDDKFTSSAVVIGRAAGCGVNTVLAAQRIQQWINDSFASNSERTTYTMVFAKGMAYHAEQQSGGKSPDNCDAVRKAYSTWPWP